MHMGEFVQIDQGMHNLPISVFTCKQPNYQYISTHYDCPKLHIPQGKRGMLFVNSDSGNL